MTRGWRTLLRYPGLALVPLGWEAITVGSASLLGLVSHADGGVRFRWPNTLPGGADLLGTSLLRGGTGPGQWLLFAATLLLDAAVAAGFLHLIAEAMRGRPPSWYGLVDGINRFGVRLVQWRLLVVAGTLLLPFVLSRLRMGTALLLVLVVCFAVAHYYLVAFLVPVRNMTLREALANAPLLLNQRFGVIALTGAACLLLSGALSYALTANHLRTLLVASPLWCFFGTWMTASMCAAVAEMPL